LKESLAIVIPLIIFFFLDLIILMSTLRQKNETKGRNYFVLFVASITITQGFTAVSYACDEKLLRMNHVLQYGFNMVSLTCMALAAFAWFAYLCVSSDAYDAIKSGYIRGMKYVQLLPVVVLVLACLVSPWTHWVMYIDENGVYQSGSVGWLQLIPYLYIIAAIVFCIISYIKGFSIRSFMRRFPLFFIASMVGAYVNMKVIRGGYVQIGCSIGVILMYLEQFMVDVNEKNRLRDVEQLNVQLQNHISVIQSMSKAYFVAFIVDMETSTFKEISSVENVRKVVGTEGDAQSAFGLFCEYMVSDDTVNELRSFTDLSTVNERMKDKEVITCDYVGKVAGWCQLYMIAGDRNQDGTLNTLFVAARTIHDEKAREEKYHQDLQEAKEAADEANEAKTNFLNNMSHDIRTPMNAILGYTELMKKNIDNKEKMMDYLSKIDSSGEYLLEIINNILDVSRIDSGKVTLDENYTDFYDENCSVIPLLENEIARKKSIFHVI